jgi:hypothetical protein
LNSDLPAVLQGWRDFRAAEKVEATEAAYVASVIENTSVEDGVRLDFQYHHPSRQEAQLLISGCAYGLMPLHALCDEPNLTLIPAQDLDGVTLMYTGLAQMEARTGRAAQEATPAAALKSQVRAYEAGDILFARMRPNLRKVAYMDVPAAGYASPESSVLRVRKDEEGRPLIDPVLLAALLRSDFVYGQIRHLVAGIGRPRLSARDLREVLIPVPPPGIQTKVRRTLSAAIEESDRLEEEARDLQARAVARRARAVDDVATAFARQKGA